MDLSDLEIPDTIAVHISIPSVGKLYADDEKKKPTIINLYSPASEQVLEFSRKVSERNIKRIGQKGLNSFDTAEELEKQGVDRLMAFTASVENLIYKGEEVTLSNIREIYENPKFGWLTDQLYMKIGDWDNFLAQ